MADERVHHAVKIVDPTTTSQQASVSGAGNLNVAVNLALPAGTNNIGDVDILSVVPGTGATALGKAEDAIHATGDTGVYVLAVRSDTAAASGADGDYVSLITDSVGRLHVTVGNTVTVSVSGSVDTELPAAAALGDNAANPTAPAVGAFLMGFDGTTWDRLYTVADGDAVAAATKGLIVLGTDGTNYQVLKTDANGELQVDVLSGGAEPTPTNPTLNRSTTAALAAGAAANLDSSEITEAEKLWQFEVTGSVPFRADLIFVENGVSTTKVTVFGRAGELVQWRAPHRNFYTHAGASVGLDVFRLTVTNMDTSEAADFYATFAYST